MIVSNNGMFQVNKISINIFKRFRNKTKYRNRLIKNLYFTFEFQMS